MADGSPLKHCGVRRVPLIVNDGKSIGVDFQVTGATKPILSVGKFCSRDGSRGAWYERSGGQLWSEIYWPLPGKKVNRHYVLECWAA